MQRKAVGLGRAAAPGPDQSPWDSAQRTESLLVARCTSTQQKTLQGHRQRPNKITCRKSTGGKKQRQGVSVCIYVNKIMISCKL